MMDNLRENTVLITLDKLKHHGMLIMIINMMKMIMDITCDLIKNRTTHKN